jgi:hypothetical protein
VGIKINTNYNRELIYVTYYNGILKFCRNGAFFQHVVENYPCTTECKKWTWKDNVYGVDAAVTWKNVYCKNINDLGAYSWSNVSALCKKSDCSALLQKFSNIVHDRYRNIYVTLNNTILKIIDRMTIDEVSYEAYAQNSLWSTDSILIDKEEYVQPWVYLKSFHRLWDNIELFRNSLFYEIEGCKSFSLPIYSKEDLKLGQNEIVTNATINRLSEQLWTNLQSIAKYFDPTCKN